MRFWTFWQHENFGQQVLTKSLKLWILPKNGVKYDYFRRRRQKAGGCKMGLGSWYGVQNTPRESTLIQSNYHVDILDGCGKIDFWSFGIFGIFGLFLVIFTVFSLMGKVLVKTWFFLRQIFQRLRVVNIWLMVRLKAEIFYFQKMKFLWP